MLAFPIRFKRVTWLPALTALAFASMPAKAQGAAPVTIVGPLPVPVAGTVGLNGPLSVTGTVSTRDADNPARSPFQLTLCTASSFGGASSSSCGNQPFSAVAPSNRRMVIEYITGECGISGDISFVRLTLQTSVGGVGGSHRLSMVRDPLDSRFFDINQLTRIYADAGSTYGLGISAGGGAGAGSYRCSITISGYTVAL